MDRAAGEQRGLLPRQAVQGVALRHPGSVGARGAAISGRRSPGRSGAGRRRRRGRVLGMLLDVVPDEGAVGEHGEAALAGGVEDAGDQRRADAPATDGGVDLGVREGHRGAVDVVTGQPDDAVVDAGPRSVPSRGRPPPSCPCFSLLPSPRRRCRSSTCHPHGSPVTRRSVSLRDDESGRGGCSRRRPDSLCPAAGRRTRRRARAPVAQGIEQRFPKPCAAGSNPAGATTVVPPRPGVGAVGLPSTTAVASVSTVAEGAT